LVATATFLSQNFAWAICSDGNPFPTGGFVVGSAALPIADNFAPGLFTGTAGSKFVPDNSVCENNEGTIDPVTGLIGAPCLVDPATGNPFPLTGGGHNWVFDQGSTTCREVDTTYNAQTAPPGIAPGSETWTIPANDNGVRCIFLPIVRALITANSITVVYTGFGDIPYQGDVITPTCDPTKLSAVGAPNPLNTRLNQLGCSITHGVAIDAQHADSFLFVSGIKGTMFRYRLTNQSNNTVVGSFPGKGVADFDVFSHIFVLNGSPKVNDATVSLDGMFATTTSTRRQPQIYTCLNPLGDPGEPSQPINPNFSIPSTQDLTRTKCLVSGNNGLQVDLTTLFGPDNQIYAGGQSALQSFLSPPGGASMPGQPPTAFYSPAAWPQCHYNGNNPFSQPVPPGNTLMQNLERVFNITPLQGNLTSAGQSNQCGTMQPDVRVATLAASQHGGYSDTSLATNPNLATLSRPGYFYTSPLTGGTISQLKVSVDPISLRSTYKARTYGTGFPGITAGIGVPDDLTYPGGAGLIDPSTGKQPGSLMVFSDKSTIGAAAQEALTRLPLCEDIP
jgi:hypothetical protein